MTFLKGLAAGSGTVLALLIAFDRDDRLLLSCNAGRSGTSTRNCSWLGPQTPLDFDDTLTDLLAGGPDLARSVRLGLSALGIQPLKV
jgi:hypothetical protein